MSIKKKIISLLSLCLMAMAVVSCNEDIDLQKERRAKNEELFQSYKGEKDYEKVSLPGLYRDAFVYMKWEDEKHKGEKPKQTDLVKMHYTGYLLSDWMKGQKESYFDTNKHLEVLQAAPVSGYIGGMKIALQNMAVGDKVGVVIPWFLGYGQYGARAIPAYAALYFEVELKEIIKR